MAANQRRFAVMGEDLFKIVFKLINNQNICRLLKYSNNDPFDPNLPDIDGSELLNHQIKIIPRISNKDNVEESYIIVYFNTISLNPTNTDFKITSIVFDIICPYNNWIINANTLRPYLLMQEIDNLFNNGRISGLGTLQFVQSKPIIISEQNGGYTMTYQINEFN